MEDTQLYNNELESPVQEINGRHDPIGKFWLTPEAETYTQFAKEVIPVNDMAIKAAHAALGLHLLNNPQLNNHAFDLGCHTGSSTIRLYTDLKNILGERAEDFTVTGADPVENFIKNASIELLQSGNEMLIRNIRFLHTPEAIDLPDDEIANSAIEEMLWVDQVIPQNKVLYEAMKKSFRVLQKGGMLVVVRVSRDSFKHTNNFAFYRHNKSMNRRLPIEAYREPEPFMNDLLLPLRNDNNEPLMNDNQESHKQSLKFIDYIRSNHFMVKLGLGVGYRNANVIPLSLNTKPKDEMEEQILDVYSSTFKKQAKIFPELEKGSDGKQVLHEMILFTK